MNPATAELDAKANVTPHSLRVSVVIPVYKAEKYLAEAVESALQQPETAEVVLVEDGSPDGSLEICQQLEKTHDRVRLYQHPGGVNRGAGPSRDLGVSKAIEPIIAFLDADDLFLPNRFTATARCFSDPTVDGVYEAVGVQIDDQSLEAWWESWSREKDVTRVDPGVRTDQLFAALVQGGRGHFCTGGIVVRKQLLDRAGSFGQLRMTQDTFMWLKLAAIGRLVPGENEKPVTVRRLHGQNRVFQNRAVHANYGRAMWRALLRWSGRAGLSIDKRELILNRILLGHACLSATASMGFGNRVSELVSLLSLLARCPGTIKLPTMRWAIRNALGLGGSVRAASS